MIRKKLFLASSEELREDRREFEIFIGRKNKDWVTRGVFLELRRFAPLFAVEQALDCGVVVHSVAVPVRRGRSWRDVQAGLDVVLDEVPEISAEPSPIVNT